MTSPSHCLDVIIIGGGFCGISLLYRTRQAGFTARIFEKAPRAGGTWYWNCYPGSRVDSEFPSYQLSFPEVYKEWGGWTERFPEWKELRKYFDFVVKRLDLEKDIQFSSTVTSCRWDDKKTKWIVTVKGHNEHENKEYQAQFLAVCIGISSKPYIPEIEGMATFKGQYFHSSMWPQDQNVTLEGKKVAVIGTGASGVQIIQTIEPIVKTLTVFQRTPNLALPMGQRKITAEENDAEYKGILGDILRSREETFAGFHFDFQPKEFKHSTPEERGATLGKIWDQGGFGFHLKSYKEIFFDKEANDTAYTFWRNNVRKRISDTQKIELLAPTVPPHPYGTKRPSLEMNYWEAMSQPNVEIIDVKQNPICQATPDGLVTSDGKEHNFDIIIFATGFDMMNGSFDTINFRGVNGLTLTEKWSERISTYLGLATSSYPNMFIMYGGQSPTPFCNAPTCADVQGEWIVNCLLYMKENELESIEATAEAELEWGNSVEEQWNNSLFVMADSWYQRKNIPGKEAQAMAYIGGLKKYKAMCKDVAENSLIRSVTPPFLFQS